MKFGEKIFQTKLSRLSHKVCRPLSSPVPLRKLANRDQFIKIFTSAPLSAQLNISLATDVGFLGLN